MTISHEIVSLFSGAGGFDHGFHLTGKFKTIFANELKIAPAQTFSTNFKFRMLPVPAAPSPSDLGTIYVGDIAHLNLNRLDGLHPTLLIGGPPCQDFSIVKGGRNKGTEVVRGRLYAHFVRAVLYLQPKLFVFENVPNLKGHSGGLAYKTILEDFQGLNIRYHQVERDAHIKNGVDVATKSGYHILYSGIVNASHLGVPQARRRLIVIGLRSDLISHVKDIYKGTRLLKRQLEGSDLLTNRYPLTPLEIFEGQPLSELGAQYRKIMRAYDTLPVDLPTDRARKWMFEVQQKLTLNVKRDYLALHSIEPADSKEFDRAMNFHSEILESLGYLGKPISQANPPDQSNTKSAEYPSAVDRMMRIPPGENHEFVRDTDWQVEGRGFSFIYRRMHPLKPAPTVVAFGGGGTGGYHYARDRSKLTNRERARLQTFSDNVLFQGTPREIRGQIGEAVPPLLSYRIAQGLEEILYQIT